MEVFSKTFENKMIELDNARYVNCTFKNCQIIYRGRAAFQLEDDTFTDCTWRFEEGAGATVDLLKFLWATPRYRDLIVDLLGINKATIH